jgi:hypothetical protein
LTRPEKFSARRHSYTGPQFDLPLRNLTWKIYVPEGFKYGDFDGTLTRPGAFECAAIKKDIGCPPNQSALEFIRSLGGREQKIAQEKLERFEYSSALCSKPNFGAEETVIRLRSYGLRLAHHQPQQLEVYPYRKGDKGRL